MRLLDREANLISLEQLGMSKASLDWFREVIERPNGIFLVTGPTGSGKTTTLYAALQTLNRPDKKILTVEDPVEYRIRGINQVQVHPQIGLNFARVLRAFLRQAPNVVLVGEIRDKETAEVAIQASLTGHIVFSTVHTNDAPSAVTRLLDMGVPPFLIATSLQGVLAQRLVRRICPECAADAPADPVERRVLDLPEGALLKRGRGCRACNGTGVRGRVGVYEWLDLDERLRETLFQSADGGAFVAAAAKSGRRQGARRPDHRGRIVARDQGQVRGAAIRRGCGGLRRSRFRHSSCHRLTMPHVEPGSRLDLWLHTIAEQDGSDLHIGAFRRPMMRVSGSLVAIEDNVLAPEDTADVLLPIVPTNRRKDLDDLGSCDFAIEHGDDRYRVNIFRQRQTYAMVCRRIPQSRLSFDQIGAPPVLRALAHLPRGLILVTGPTGSGKTTTLAALIHEINIQRSTHIVTLEDPIEFLHESLKAVVNQREVGEDVSSFSEGLRRVLRQDPDVILLGEMRDLETTAAGITAAETGHLVFGTLHTTGAARTMDRIIDQYPKEQQEQVRAQLAVSLQAVVSQVLVPKASGKGRVAAFEIMIRNSAIENHIRKGETFKIPSVMQTQKRLGMQLLDDHLFELANDGVITKETALTYAQLPGDLRQRFSGGAPSTQTH
jgi:twitching motility protein PilT